jgi:hypothetical protein
MDGHEREPTFDSGDCDVVGLPVAVAVHESLSAEKIDVAHFLNSSTA